MKLLTLVFLLFTACASRNVKDPEAARGDLFPNGSYQHEVTLTLKSGRSFHFGGAVKIQRPALSLAGFSPLGTTLFRITDDGASPLKTEIYADQLKPYEGQMRQFYGTLKSLLDAPVSDKRERELKTPSGPAQLTFEHFDAHKIPDEIEVKSEQFSMHIKVVSYDI